MYKKVIIICVVVVSAVLILWMAMGWFSGTKEESVQAMFVSQDTDSMTDSFNIQNSLGDIVLGVDIAPVTIIEYSSLTCGHCGRFHNTVLPVIKREYVDTQKVRFIFKPFPMDPHATAGAMLAQCVIPKARLLFLETLFKRQAQWIRTENPLEQLQIISKQVGLAGEDFVTCLNDGDSLENIRMIQRMAADQLGVRSTPTFFINGEKVEGNVGIEKFRAIIDRKLAEDNRM